MRSSSPPLHLPHLFTPKSLTNSQPQNHSPGRHFSPLSLHSLFAPYSHPLVSRPSLCKFFTHFTSCNMQPDKVIDFDDDSSNNVFPRPLPPILPSLAELRRQQLNRRNRMSHFLVNPCRPTPHDRLLSLSSNLGSGVLANDSQHEDIIPPKEMDYFNDMWFDSQPEDSLSLEDGVFTDDSMFPDSQLNLAHPYYYEWVPDTVEDKLEERAQRTDDVCVPDSLDDETQPPDDM